jgi:hypothetical protein
MAIPCKRPATRQRARQCSQNVRVIHGQPLTQENRPALQANLKRRPMWFCFIKRRVAPIVEQNRTPALMDLLSR